MNSIRTISLNGFSNAFLNAIKCIFYSFLILLAFVQNIDAQNCTNLLMNESFENGLANWTTTGNVELGDNSLTGSQSAKLCTNGYSTLSQVFPAQPGVDYTASLWAKMEDETTQAQAVLRYLDANYVPIPTNSDQVYVSIDNYQQYHLKNISPANTAYAHVLLWKNGDGCLETDDWELCEGSVPIKPDLSVNQLTVTPSSLNPGDTLTVDFMIANFGTANLNGIYDTHIFISETPTLDQNSFELASSLSQTVTEGFFITSTFFPIIPANFDPGNYHLIVALDYDEQYDELNEANNFSVMPIEILGTGNVCQGDVILESQADVDAFSGCQVIEGSLVIRSPFGASGASSDITDLSPLLSITSVGGNIQFENNDFLTDLHGLENIVHPGTTLVIRECENLTSLQQLSGINGVLDYLILWDNPSLSDIDALIGISGVENTLSLIRNTSLPDLNGLSNIGFVNGDFELNENTSLIDITGLSNLSEAGRDVIIANNIKLTSLDGLENLASVGNGLVLAGNDLLQDVSALNSLTNVDVFLYVAVNPMLSDCCIFENLLSTNDFTGTVTIENNADGCNSEQEIESACNPDICTGDVILQTQADVDNFQGCEIIQGNLYIGTPFGFFGPPSDVHNLGPLLSLKEVTGKLNIGNSNGLADLHGLENLESINDLVIGRCESLTNMDALSSLQGTVERIVLSNLPSLINVNPLSGITQINDKLSIDSAVLIQDIDAFINTQFLDGVFFLFTNNPSLENIHGLSNLSTVPKELRFQGCHGLQSLVGLESLTSTDRLIISNNDALENLDPLGNLESVLENISISQNDALVSLEGLSQLTNVPFLAITSHNSLESLEGLNNITSVDYLGISDNLVLNNISALAGLNEVNEDFSMIRNPLLNDCCVLYDLLNNIDPGVQVTFEDNAGFCNSPTDILNNCAPQGEIDLELSMSNSTPNPTIYSNYTVTLTVTNTANAIATGIIIHFPKPAGVVYTGGNEFTASTGNFNPFTNEEWTINSLDPNDSATLTVNYFLLQNDLPVAYAQVTAANEPDVDSTPSNGTPPTVNEDDEASSGNTSPPIPKPDLGITDLQILPVPVTANGGTFSFFLINDGLATVDGSYEIGIYISNDEMISNDDMALPVFTEQNTPMAILNRSGTIPANLPPGDYFLIVKADVNEVIPEVVENDNLVTKAFSIEGLTCTGNFFLTTQAEVNNFPNCSVINGDLSIQPPAGLLTTDITDLSPLLSLTKVTGTLRIHLLDKITDLHGLDNIDFCSRLSIFDCDSLISMQALSGLQGEMDRVFISNNYSLLNIDALAGITALNDGTSVTFNESLQSIIGFADLIRAGNGDEAVHIGNNPSLTSLHGLENLTTADGYLQIEACNALISLDGLNNVVTTGQLIIHLNDLLQDISALSSLTTITEDLYVYRNPMLSDCCILEDLLSNGGFSFQIYDNASSCNSNIDILNACASQGPDLELSMTATNENPSIYTSSPVTVNVVNQGSETVTGVVVHFPKPSGTAYTGGNEITASQGSFNPYGNEEWTVGELAPGASATIKVNYFYLTSDALTPFAQVVAQNEPDTDSSPNNGTCCTPLEDDEATILLNGFNGNGTNALSVNLSRLRMFFDNIYPNPAKHWVNVEIYTPKAQPAIIDFYDATGKSVHRIEVDLQEGENEIGLDVSDWRSGTYTLIGRGEGHPAYGRFLKVWE